MGIICELLRIRFPHETGCVVEMQPFITAKKIVIFSHLLWLWAVSVFLSLLRLIVEFMRPDMAVAARLECEAYGDMAKNVLRDFRSVF